VRSAQLREEVDPTYSMRTVGSAVDDGIVRCQTASEDCHGVAESAGFAVLHGCTDAQDVLHESS
jgi:hypothetical protein